MRKKELPKIELTILEARRMLKILNRLLDTPCYIDLPQIEKAAQELEEHVSRYGGRRF